MSEPLRTPRGAAHKKPRITSPMKVGLRPTTAQRRYLMRGVGQPGGKLPLFDRNGREIDRKTIESCVLKGWATPWFDNPVTPNWLVCKLTPAGYQVLGHSIPANDG